MGAVGSFQRSAEVNSACAKVFASGKTLVRRRRAAPLCGAPGFTSIYTVSMIQKAAGGLVLRGLRWLFLFFTSGGGPGRPGSPSGYGGGEAG